jgi:hypothetical protein
VEPVVGKVEGRRKEFEIEIGLAGYKLMCRNDLVVNRDDR